MQNGGTGSHGDGVRLCIKRCAIRKPPSARSFDPSAGVGYGGLGGLARLRADGPGCGDKGGGLKAVGDGGARGRLSSKALTL
jgi:hypothetical protein